MKLRYVDEIADDMVEDTTTLIPRVNDTVTLSAGESYSNISPGNVLENG